MATGLGGCAQILGIDSDLNRVVECGDGLLEGSEACDDGNAADGDSCNADCTAETCQVPTTHPTIAAAISDDACSGIQIAAGSYDETLSITRALLIEGVGDVTINGDGTSSVIQATAPLVLRRLTVSGGSSDRGGGLFSSADLELVDVVVAGNSATVSGAGVYVRDAKLTGTNLTVRNNSLAGAAEGGGVFIADGSIELTGSMVTTNSSTNASGEQSSGIGLMLRETSGSLTDVSISENQCTGGTCFGVGIGIRGGVLTLTNVDLATNSSVDTTTTYGVGLFAAGVDLNINQVSATDNSARTDIVVIASYRGGGLYLEDSAVILEEVDVQRNMLSNRDGGAAGAGIHSIALTSSSSLDANKVNVDANEAISTIGVCTAPVIVRGSAGTATTSFNQSSISNNSCRGRSTYGGGIFIFGTLALPASATLQNTTISSNRINSDPIDDIGGANGAGVAIDLADVDIRHLTIANNEIVDSPNESGGGMFVFSGSATISNSVIANNVATRPECGANNDQLIQIDSSSIISAECVSTGTPQVANPLLGPLADNGGSTQTHVLEAGSLAINSGSAIGCRALDNSAIDVDQRGLPRDSQCDVGAFEVQ